MFANGSCEDGTASIFIQGSNEQWEDLFFYIGDGQDLCVRVCRDTWYPNHVFRLCVLCSIEVLDEDGDYECRSIFASVPVDKEVDHLGFPRAVDDLIIYTNCISEWFHGKSFTREGAKQAVRKAQAQAREMGSIQCKAISLY